MESGILFSAMKKVSGKTKNIIISSTVCAVAMTAGIGLALFFGKGLFQTVSKKAPGDWLAYEDDISALVKKYDKAGGNVDLFQPYEIANVAIAKYEATENHYSILKGEAHASAFGVPVTQYINTTCIKNGDSLFLESISKSDFADPAYRFYENLNEDFVSIYEGEIHDKKGNDATWDASSKNDMDKDTFENTLGKTLSCSNIYTISSKTVIDSTLKKQADGTYEVDITLDPTKANKRYIRQVWFMSKPNGDPIFKELDMHFVLDKDLKIITKTIHEFYNITVGVAADTDTKMIETCFYDEVKEIPDLNTKCNYGG